jgi:hypothetical protein
MAETEAETSILDDVKAAMAENAGEAPVPAASETPAEAPAGETAQQTADRVRDEQGRFAKAEEGKPRETLKLKEKPQEQPAPSQAGTVPSPTKDVPAAPAVQNGLDAPPLHWKGSQKVAWGKLPAEVRQGVLDDHKALQDERAQFEPLTKALEPFREAFVREAGSMESAVAQLGQFHQASLTNPTGLALHILQARGIDPRQFAAQILGQQPQGGTPPQPQAPDINSVVAQAVQQAIAPIQQRFEQTDQQQTLSVIETFRADPKHPFFEDVKVHMGHLLRAGVAKDLQDAYDQATWANPVIRQHLTSAQAEEAKQASSAAAAKARGAAAASLRGSPLPNGSAATGSGATVLDDVRAAMTELSGA